MTWLKWYLWLGVACTLALLALMRCSCAPDPYDVDENQRHG